MERPAFEAVGGDIDAAIHEYLGLLNAVSHDEEFVKRIAREGCQLGTIPLQEE